MRQTWETYLATGGWWGHCHVPENDHWDPGPIDQAAFFAAAGITTQEDDPMAMTPEDRTALAKEIGREVAQALLSAPIGTSAADAPADLGWGLYRIQSELMRLRGLVEQALDESKAAQP